VHKRHFLTTARESCQEEYSAFVFSEEIKYRSLAKRFEWYWTGNDFSFVRSEITMAVNMKIYVLWNMTPYSLVAEWRRLRSTYWPPLSGVTLNETKLP
jgi:hypothetical protein